MMALFRAIVFLVIVVLLGYYAGWVPLPFIQKSLSELEKECVVAAVHSDARWAGDLDDAVRREVARSVVRNARHFQKDVCDVFRSGLTLTPPGYKRIVPGYFRTEKYIKISLEATDASWKSDLLLVEDVLKTIKDDTGCATHYIRKSRLSDLVAQSRKARTAMKAQMRSVGKAKDEKGTEIGEAEFFCPK